MTTSIREATSGDVQALIGLLYESDTLHWNALPDHFDDPGEPARREGFVNHLLDEENGVFLVAELGARSSASFSSPSSPVAPARIVGSVHTHTSATLSSPRNIAAGTPAACLWPKRTTGRTREALPRSN